MTDKAVLNDTRITDASTPDVDEAVRCLVSAFAQDPITGYLLQFDGGYLERLTDFFSLLMRARIALRMPVLVARSGAGIGGVAMGYSTTRPRWPPQLVVEMERFSSAIPGLADRAAHYEAVASRFKPATPHYYLGAIGVAPELQGRKLGAQLLDSFCAASASDRSSDGVYLETARESTAKFYERAGFVETGRGDLGGSPLWCMYLSHENRRRSHR